MLLHARFPWQMDLIIFLAFVQLAMENFFVLEDPTTSWAWLDEGLRRLACTPRVYTM